LPCEIGNRSPKHATRPVAGADHGGRREEIAFRALAQATRTAHLAPPLAPRVLRGTLAGPSAPVYRLLTRREHTLIGSGHPSMPGIDPRNYAERHAV